MDLSAVISHNPILTGGAALGVAGSIFASLKSIPLKVAAFLKRKFIYTIEIEGHLHRMVKDDILPKYVGNHNYPTAQLKSYDVEEHTKERSKREWRVDYTFAPGEHLVWVGRIPVWVHRTKEKKENSATFTERLWLTTFVIFKKKISDFFRKEILDGINKARDKHNVFMWTSEIGWAHHQTITKRKLDTIVLEDSVKDALVGDIENFLMSEKWYQDRGIPYHRGYFLYGPPGNGKSSLIQTIAGYFNYDIYVLNLAASELDDSRLLNALSKIDDGILLIEDVDAQFEGRVNKNTDNSKAKLTFSGLLNALDGVGAKDGRITFVTTNHVEKIDEALLRPGRLDFKMRLENASEWQGKCIFNKFFPDSPFAAEFGRLGKGMNVASLQNHLLMHRYRDTDAIESFRMKPVEKFIETFKEPVALSANGHVEMPAA